MKLVWILVERENMDEQTFNVLTKNCINTSTSNHGFPDDRIVDRTDLASTHLLFSYPGCSGHKQLILTETFIYRQSLSADTAGSSVSSKIKSHHFSQIFFTKAWLQTIIYRNWKAEIYEEQSQFMNKSCSHEPVNCEAKWTRDMYDVLGEIFLF